MKKMWTIINWGNLAIWRILSIQTSTVNLLLKINKLIQISIIINFWRNGTRQQQQAEQHLLSVVSKIVIIKVSLEEIGLPWAVPAIPRRYRTKNPRIIFQPESGAWPSLKKTRKTRLLFQTLQSWQKTITTNRIFSIWTELLESVEKWKQK